MEQKECKDYIEREDAINEFNIRSSYYEAEWGNKRFTLNNVEEILRDVPAADVRPVSEIEKIIESLQEQADIYNARAQELLVEEDGQVSQYTWAVSLRETYRRIIKTLDDLIS